MSTKPYRPQADSLAAQVCAFLMRNPDEELTVEDIAQKFETNLKNVHTQLARAVEADLLVRSRSEDGEYLYTKGQELKANTVRPDQPPAKASSASIAKIYAGQVIPDPAQVPIDTDPALLPKAIMRPAAIDWLVLLKRLGVGHSAQLPMRARCVLSTAITQAHKQGLGKFKTATDPGGNTFRVGRVA